VSAVELAAALGTDYLGGFLGGNSPKQLRGIKTAAAAGQVRAAAFGGNRESFLLASSLVSASAEQADGGHSKQS
jgi:hypothetical protein